VTRVAVPRPKADEFKYVCQGIATNGDVAVVFTIPYDEAGKASAAKALESPIALPISKPA